MSKQKAVPTPSSALSFTTALQELALKGNLSRETVQDLFNKYEATRDGDTVTFPDGSKAIWDGYAWILR